MHFNVVIVFVLVVFFKCYQRPYTTLEISVAPNSRGRGKGRGEKSCAAPGCQGFDSFTVFADDALWEKLGKKSEIKGPDNMKILIEHKP